MVLERPGAAMGEVKRRRQQRLAVKVESVIDDLSFETYARLGKILFPETLIHLYVVARAARLLEPAEGIKDRRLGTIDCAMKFIPFLEYLDELDPDALGLTREQLVESFCTACFTSRPLQESEILSNRYIPRLAGQQVVLPNPNCEPNCKGEAA
jgi:hypothetical protein